MITMRKVAFCWTCALLISIAGSVAAQNPNSTAPRMVILERSLPRPLLPDDPVKIVKVLFDGLEVKTGLHALPTDVPGVPFPAGDDWCNHLTVVLKNISAKKIVYADIQTFFPALAEGSETGERPEHARYFQGSRRDDPARDSILIEPGQEFSLSAIDPRRFGEVKQAIEATDSLSAVTSLRLELGTVYFEDGTKWAGGVHYRPDDALLGKYVRVSQREFDAYRREVSQ